MDLLAFLSFPFLSKLLSSILSLKGVYLHADPPSSLICLCSWPHVFLFYLTMDKRARHGFCGLLSACYILPTSSCLDVRTIHVACKVLRAAYLSGRHDAEK
mmetsp:Transcript_7949/g.15482  ORF Transcript_7949/g.15482 Transcript_7949/m.15482 type:complete len:101 (-) Transcript_7949:793-1095(-)